MWVRRVGFLLALLGLLAATPRGVAGPPAGSPASDEYAAFVAALGAFRTGDWDSAAREFRVAADGSWTLAKYARLFLAETLSRVGELSEARQIAESLAADAPASLLSPEALLLAASLASRDGDEAGAERLLRQFVSRFPANGDAPLARYLLGLALEAQGRPVEAVATFRELWLLAPATAYGEAAAERLEVLAQGGVLLALLTPEELVERAERLLAGNSPAAAREAGEALLGARPAPDVAFRALTVVVQSLRRLGQYAKAARSVERYLALTPPARRPHLLLELARLQHRAGARESALTTLDRLLRQFPKERDAAAALVVKAQLLEETGRLAEAARVYQRAVTEFPDREAAALALWRVGWIRYFGREYARAAREFGRLVELPPGQSYRLAAAYWAGRSHEALEERAQAQRFFRLVLDEAPRSYYGILAARRAGAGRRVHYKSVPVALPSDPLAPLATDVRFARAEALRSFGLSEYATAEIEELSAASVADQVRLYGLSAFWAREEEYHRALRILRRYFADVALSGHPGVPLRFWEILYPMGWREELAEVATQAGLDAYLLAAVVREESSFFPRARSRVGARGLMQLMPETARSLARRRGLAFGDGDLLDDPKVNLELGTEFFVGLLREFGDPRLAVAAYNAGPVRVRAWWGARRGDDLEVFVEQIPFDETRHFVKRVMVSWEEYRRVYGASG